VHLPAMAKLLCLFAVVAVPEAAAEERRQLASVGCDNCCFRNDCSLAFSMTQPGVCCGAHPYSNRRQTGCCPMGASCVACGNIWKCTRSTYVTRTSKCSICRDDPVRECMFSHRSGYGGHYGGSSFISVLFLLLVLCAIAACFFYGGQQEEVVVVQGGPQYGQPIGMPGQTVVVQGGGYGYGPGAGMATGAAAGFVGGMMVGEALDHGGGYGYGGGYGGGGYGGGDMGGGDMGFSADQ